MKTYELQTYQSGNWKFDSYFDSRDLVLSEAERMEVSGRYAGVRVLEERFDEAKQASTYHTIFSRYKKIDGDDWRSAVNRAQTVAAYGSASGRSPSQRPAARPKSTSDGNLAWLLLGATAIVVVGIAVILALREFAATI